MSRGEKALLPMEAIEVFYDGTLTDPQLNHPEGICVDKDGNIWCGGERGEIFKIAADGSSMELVASTNGFNLGLNFDKNGRLYICDNKRKGVYRYDTASGELVLFTTGGGGMNMRFPNYPVVDHNRMCLYVSDSYSFDEAGPGVWKVDLNTGHTELWSDESYQFANGLALTEDGSVLYVAETWGRCVSRIRIDEQGRASGKELYVKLPDDVLPDGLALDSRGNLYISCYEPSCVYIVDTRSPNPEARLLAYDPDAHAFCHPTNCAVRGNELFTCNLGRWHVSRVKLDPVLG